jgi:hypothetical protein
MTISSLHFLGRSLSVTQALDRGNNNFDLFRLIAALTVIYGHSFALASSPGFDDSLFKLTGYHSAIVAPLFQTAN